MNIIHAADVEESSATLDDTRLSEQPSRIYCSVSPLRRDYCAKRTKQLDQVTCIWKCFLQMFCFFSSSPPISTKHVSKNVSLANSLHRAHFRTIFTPCGSVTLWNQSIFIARCLQPMIAPGKAETTCTQLDFFPGVWQWVLCNITVFVSVSSVDVEETKELEAPDFFPALSDDLFSICYKSALDLEQVRGERRHDEMSISNHIDLYDNISHVVFLTNFQSPAF